MSHILRCKSKKNETNTCLDTFIFKSKLFIILDKDNGLVSEWQETCNADIIKVLITHWEKGIIIIDNPQKYSSAQSKSLRRFGFNDTIDKLILRLAISISDSAIVSDDSDFWDPKIKGSQGDYDTVVAKFIKREFNVDVLILTYLIDILSLVD